MEPNTDAGTGNRGILIRGAGPVDMQEVRQLFREYCEFLGVDLGFQNFQEELDSLPGYYTPPSGALLLSEFKGETAGCVSLRRIDRAT